MLDINEVLELEKKWENYNRQKILKKFSLPKRLITKKTLYILLAVIFLTVSSVALQQIYKPKDEMTLFISKVENAKKRYEESHQNDAINQETRGTTSTPQGWLYFNEIPTNAKKDQETMSYTQEHLEEESQLKPALNLADANLSIKELEDSFKESNDKEIAALLAKKYFDNKDYKNSEKWSILASDNDEIDEENLIIMARSKYRQNNKKEAIKILEEYNKSANSKNVENWIKKMSK